MTIGRDPRRAGFTLVELLVVIAIIGIIISFILVAAADGVRRAEERATQSLITKLDFAVNDRIDALFNTYAPINQTHRYLAAINVSISGSYVPTPGSIEGRAQVIAQNDFIRSELPDVFYRISQTSDSGYASTYPLSFAGMPYPINNPSGDVTDFFLPLGNTYPGLPFKSDGITPTYPRDMNIPNSGIFGASFSAAGGIYKNLGYQKKGYDGVDNTGNGLIDDLSESGTTSAAVEALLAKHQHKTARSEMLYAVLVEGLGPLGSVFNREDFTDKEVRDTDGDGLPEFTDAWGEPLQFYRWPIYFGEVPGTSDTQRGSLQYNGPSDIRQQDNFDPNQQLVAPGWWYKTANPGLTTIAGFTTPSFAPPNSTSTSGNMSQGAIAFSTYFRSLVDPISSSTNGSMWDRSNAMNRRAYYSRFLILSSGPDKEPGVGQFDKDYAALVDNPAGVGGFTFPVVGSNIATNTQYLTLIENQAAQEDPRPSARSGSFWEAVLGTGGSAITYYLQNVAGPDDITNHNISAPGTGVR